MPTDCRTRVDFFVPFGLSLSCRRHLSFLRGSGFLSNSLYQTKEVSSIVNEHIDGTLFPLTSRFYANFRSAKVESNMNYFTNLLDNMLIISLSVSCFQSPLFMYLQFPLLPIE